MPLPFTILARGDWRPGAVRVTRVPSGRRVVPEVEAGIAAAWAAAARPGVQLFDGPMCRLESFAATPRVLTLCLSVTSYRPFVGTNLARAAALVAGFGPDVLANPVGASVALVTADGHLLLGRRGPRVAYYPGRVHPFAGALEPDESADPFAVARRELREELGLADENVRDLRVIGLAQDDSIHQPELIFAATTDLDRASLAATLDPAEHDALWPVPATVEAMRAATLDEQLTPIACATVTLYAEVLVR